TRNHNPEYTTSKRILYDQERSMRNPNATRKLALKLSGSSFKFAADQLVDFASGMLADWAVQVDRESARRPCPRLRLHFSDRYKRMGWRVARSRQLRSK